MRALIFRSKGQGRVRQCLRCAGKISALALLGSAVWAFFSGSPWSPTRRQDWQRLMRVLNVQPNERVVELGCGDGRVSVAIAESSHAFVTGVELSLSLVVAAKLRVLRHGVGQRVKIRWRNFYHWDFRSPDVVFLYLTPRTLFRLSQIFTRQLRKNTRVISYAYPIPGWHPHRVDQPAPSMAPIYEYRMGPGLQQMAYAIKNEL